MCHAKSFTRSDRAFKTDELMSVAAAVAFAAAPSGATEESKSRSLNIESLKLSFVLAWQIAANESSHKN